NGRKPRGKDNDDGSGANCRKHTTDHHKDEIIALAAQPNGHLYPARSISLIASFCNLPACATLIKLASNFPHDLMSLDTSALGFAGNSMFFSANIACASFCASHSSNLRAASGCFAYFVTPPPEIFTWVPPCLESGQKSFTARSGFSLARRPK